MILRLGKISRVRMAHMQTPLHLRCARLQQILLVTLLLALYAHGVQCKRELKQNVELGGAPAAAAIPQRQAQRGQRRSSAAGSSSTGRLSSYSSYEDYTLETLVSTMHVVGCTLATGRAAFERTCGPSDEQVDRRASGSTIRTATCTSTARRGCWTTCMETISSGNPRSTRPASSGPRAHRSSMVRVLASRVIMLVIACTQRHRQCACKEVAHVASAACDQSPTPSNSMRLGSSPNT